MTSRSIRRAAERKQRKLAQKAPQPLASSQENTPARLAANRANAQLSTGPTTTEGKAKSSKNAVRTALTGRTVLLPTDDADRYAEHLENFEHAYQPVGACEIALVQSIADTAWRLDRIPGLEEALYARGAEEFAQPSDDLDPSRHESKVLLRTYLAYERQLRNLNLQESRLQRQRQKLVAELQQLQHEREQKEKAELALAARLYTQAETEGTVFNPAALGFEFSNTEIESYLEGIRSAKLANATFHTSRSTRSERVQAA